MVTKSFLGHHVYLAHKVWIEHGEFFFSCANEHLHVLQHRSYLAKEHTITQNYCYDRYCFYYYHTVNQPPYFDIRDAPLDFREGGVGSVFWGGKFLF